jgi:hypothetical protein
MPHEKLDPADLIEIHQLISSYGLFLDSQQWDRFALVFTPDGVFDATGMGWVRCVGRDAIIETLSAIPAGSVHHLTTGVFAERVDGEARATTKWVAEAGGSLMGGVYHDLLDRSDEGWQIRVRTIESLWSVAGAAGT